MPSDPTQPRDDTPSDTARARASETAAPPQTAPAAPPHPQTPAERPQPSPHRELLATLRARLRKLERARAERPPQVAAPPPPATAAKPKPKRPHRGGMVWRDVSATGWTTDKQRAFLEHLATHGCVSHAAASVGLSKQSAYALRHRGGRTMFALAWDVAVRSARKALLDEALERAFAGRATPVWYRGEQVGERIVHNDRLLMQLLAHTFEPIDLAYEELSLAQAWPTLLAQVDAELPFDIKTLRERGADHDENGNDRDR